MERQTLTQFRNENFEGENTKIIKIWLVRQHKKAIYFIDKLLENKIQLSAININDWTCNSVPSVYVGSRRYYRLAKNDYKLALNCERRK